MAFVLNTPYGELEPYKITLLAALKQLAETSPFTVADAKTALETSQSTTFTETSFKALLTSLYNMQNGTLDNSQLTATEKDIFNKIREYIAPAPFLSNCSDDDPTSEGVVLSYVEKIAGSNEYELQVVFTTPYKCSIVTIEPTQTAGTLTPTVLAYVSIIRRHRRTEYIFRFMAHI